MSIHPPITGTEAADRLAIRELSRPTPANARSVAALGQFLFAEGIGLRYS